MSDRLRLTILGCGSSPGVPRITGEWGACDPSNPRNRRLRASALVERIRPDGAKTTVVIDTGPDFREQMIRAGVKRLDAAVYTHPHADHIHGIDDLRGYVQVQRKRMDVYADDATMARLIEGFGYCFETPPGSDYPPILTGHRIEHYVPFTIDGDGGPLTFLPLPHQHGLIHCLGFRIGPFAYCSDINDFYPQSLPHLQGLELLVVGALQYAPHPNHLSLKEALEWIERLKPERAVLTHMHVPLDYRAVQDATPDHVEPAYDGLVIETTIPSDCIPSN
jgi:phosphoribosyl 1,2-cyclic phosphate phosphodiesterase